MISSCFVRQNMPHVCFCFSYISVISVWIASVCYQILHLPTWRSYPHCKYTNINHFIAYFYIHRCIITHFFWRTVVFRSFICWTIEPVISDLNFICMSIVLKKTKLTKIVELLLVIKSAWNGLMVRTSIWY